MPIYEYVCRQCGHEFEWLTRDGEKPICPSCNRQELDKKLSLPAAHTSPTPGPACPTTRAGRLRHVELLPQRLRPGRLA